MSLLRQSLLVMTSITGSRVPWGASSAAAGAATLPTLWQHMSFSTEAGSDEGSIVEKPKKRGRPPKKAKAAAAEGTPSVAAAGTEAEAPPPSTSAAAAEPTPLPSAASTPPPAAPRLQHAEMVPVGRSKRPVEGISTVSSLLPPSDPFTLHSKATIADLFPGAASSSSPIPVRAYVDVPPGTLPEAEAAFYHDPILTADRIKQPHYGCKGVTAEFDTNKRRAIMHRTALAKLVGEVASQQHRAVLVDGWTGSGKSVALYAVAAAARAAGWVVIYVPSATLMVEGGRFYRSDVKGDPMWDTPEAAKHIITGVVNAHADQLRSMPSTVPGAPTLHDVAQTGLAAGATPRAVVEAAIALKDGILGYAAAAAAGGAVKGAAVIVDGYNTLYSHTAYHEPMSQFHRRPIACDELRLASAFRVLDPSQPHLAGGTGAFNSVAIAAPTFGARVSPGLVLPLAPATLTIRVPRYDLGEVAAVAAMALTGNVIPEVPSDAALRRALALTNGNAKELREQRTTLLLEEGPLGLSMGYKVAALQKKAYSLALDE